MQAITDLQRLLAVQETKYGRNHAKVAVTLEALADLLALEHKYAQAEQYYWRVFEIRHNAEGQSLGVASIMHELATLNEKQGNIEEAEHLLRRSCDIKKKLLGAHSEEYKSARKALEDLLGEDLSDWPDELSSVAPLDVSQRATDFPWTERFNRGVDLLDSSEYEGAEELFSCLVAFAEHFAPRTIQHARSLDHLARAYLFQGRFKESLVQFEQALSIFENVAGADDMDTIECLEGAADAHAALDQFEQARFLYSWALSVAQEQNFVDPAERIHSKMALLPFRTAGQVVDEEAAAAARQALRPLRKKKTSKAHKPVLDNDKDDTGIPSGGMKALLADVGPPAKKKTGTVPKLSSMVALPGPTAVSPPQSVEAQVSAVQIPVVSPPPLPSSLANPPSSDSLSNPAATGSNTTANAEPSSAAEPPAGVSEEKSPLAATSLDELLKDLVPRRKKTTTTIMKPTMAQLAAAANGHESKVDTAQTAEHSVMDHLQQTAALLRAAELDPSSVAAAAAALVAGTAKAGNVAKPAIDGSALIGGPGWTAASVKAEGTNTGSTGGAIDLKSNSEMTLYAEPENRDFQAPAVIEPQQSFQIDSVQETEATGFALPDQVAQEPEKPAPTFDELLAAGGIISQRHHAAPEKELGTFSKPVPSAPVPITPINDDYLVWEQHRDLAKDFFSRRNYAEAERCSLIALESAEKLFQKHDRRLWHAHCQLAAIFEARAKFVPAAHLYSSVLGMCQRVLGPNHPDNAKLLEQLGALYMVQDRWAQAEECYERAIQILERVDPNEATNAMSKLSVVKKRRDRMQRRRK